MKHGYNSSYKLYNNEDFEFSSLLKKCIKIYIEH